GARGALGARRASRVVLDGDLPVAVDSVLRAATMYLVLLLVFRIVGKRTLAQITPFDMVLLLIIAESTQIP
ncbi:MAG TPA: hypothetical protein VIF59_02840, partial [Methylomirabilota bacterium]